PAFHPCFGERARFLLGAGSGLPAKAGRPSPAHESIGADVVHQLLQRATPVAPGIFDLCADLTERLTFPRHLTRCEVPFRVARHVSGIEVGLLVADRTAHRWQAMTVGAARGWWSRPCSPWRGWSPAGWQFTQRGFVSTFPSSVNIAADCAAVSAIAAKLSGGARLSDWSETASAADIPVSRATSATRTFTGISHLSASHRHQRRSGQPSRLIAIELARRARDSAADRPESRLVRPRDI